MGKQSVRTSQRKKINGMKSKCQLIVETVYNQRRMRKKRVKLNGQCERENEEVTLNVLAQTMLNCVSINVETVKRLANGQTYTKHPMFALAYFYCVGTHPQSHLMNDQFVSDDEVIAQLNDLISIPIDSEVASGCQKDVEMNGRASAGLVACASCNERLWVHNNDKNVVEVPIECLSSSFQLSSSELSSCLLIRKDVFEEHVSVLEHKGLYYHLNPSLVYDVEKIVLCVVCAKNPLSNPFSLANGHDYGRLGKLPELNTTTRHAISPVQCQNIDVLVRENHCIGHSIAYPQDGSIEWNKVLPVEDVLNRPRVTFLGPRESWRKIQHKYKHLFDIDTDAAYRYLDVWVALKNPSFHDIVINSSGEMKERLGKVGSEIAQSVVCSDDNALGSMASFLDEDFDYLLPIGEVRASCLLHET
jgi:hypothetical protein